MVKDILILKRNRIFLTPKFEIKEKVLHALHNPALASHPGITKTYQSMRERFIWKGFKQDVSRHVQECAQCQENKEEHAKPVGLLQPLPIPQQKWEDVCMGFIAELPKVQGKDNIFVVVDRITKFAHFYAIGITYMTTQLADLFFREVFRLHGLPRRIVTDRDNKFMSLFWQEIFRLSGTNLTPSTNYHPQTYGQMEIVNRWVEGYLKYYVTR